MDAYASSSRSAHVSGASSCSLATLSASPSRCSGTAVSLRRFSMSSGPSTVMIRRAGELSERMMTGQSLGAKQVAIASARTPAQSRNVTPARSRTSRSIRSSRTRAACCRNSPAARRSSAPPRMSVQTAGASRQLGREGRRHRPNGLVRDPCRRDDITLSDKSIQGERAQSRRPVLIVSPGPGQQVRHMTTVARKTWPHTGTSHGHGQA